jgi:predicted nucleic acid-binding protein
MMTFADLTAGDSVFVDANTFIYHYAPDPVLGPACSQLLQRIENQELTGFTSMHLLAEVVHKLMTIEANAVFGWPIAGMANRLRRHPAEVQKLSAYRIALDQISQSRTQVIEVPLATLRNAAAVCRQTGLLINDALVVGLMQQHGLTRLASYDADFDRVPGLTRYAPA